MTVIFSKKCEIGLQAVLFLSAQPKGEMFSAAEIAEKLGVPKDFTAKILQFLTADSIVESKKGKNGGFFIGKDPKDIKLIDVVKIIDGEEMFHNCVLGFPGCSVEKPCPVHHTWGKLRDETYNMLAEENLADLREKTKYKLGLL